MPATTPKLNALGQANAEFALNSGEIGPLAQFFGANGAKQDAKHR
ncbi:hypothetical protein [Siccirubricoccus soli]|nr:hypothetical protein [Siccirubricoccus soli]